MLSNSAVKEIILYLYDCSLQAPDASQIRPLVVLKKSLDHVKECWKAKNKYFFVCEQFKSIRQDLTVSIEGPVVAGWGCFQFDRYRPSWL